ncbi:protein twisted gastrulation-like [Onthophagus taurus]|uniref:protein twisted gastrulation-like n=1 Tax=Onthophagus taurus TaxID=166361 RepID=UPI0039BE7DDB
MWKSVSILTASIIITFFLIQLSSTCNEAVCGSIVSKCLLTQSCKCDYNNCTCCKECFHCLGYSFTECCSCVDMCPKLNDTGLSLSKQSSIEDFQEKVPGLFTALTEQPDPEDRWISYTFAIQFDPLQFAPSTKDYKLQLQSSDPNGKPLPTPNCTVAFMTNCLSHSKCRAHCQSMGASSVRWFHNGCCECVGDSCINYGIGESKCLKCSSIELNTIDEENYDDYSYGEGADDNME